MMTKGGSYQPSSPGHIVSYIGEKTDKKIPQFIPSGDGIWPPKDKLWGKVKHKDLLLMYSIVKYDIETIVKLSRNKETKLGSSQNIFILPRTPI